MNRILKTLLRVAAWAAMRFATVCAAIVFTLNVYVDATNLVGFWTLAIASSLVLAADLYLSVFRHKAEEAVPDATNEPSEAAEAATT